MMIGKKMINYKQSAEISRNWARNASQRPTLRVEDMIAAAIEADICDRRGLKQQWQLIDEDIQEEILETWREIIKQELCEWLRTIINEK